MAETPVRRAQDGAAFLEHLSRGRAWLVALIPILLVGAVFLARGSLITEPPTAVSLTGAVGDLSPTELKATAAEALETATRSGGAGYTFEIVQRSTMHQRPGGPPIAVDPTDSQKGPELTTAYPLATYLETGFVTPAGYWAEIRRGPDDPTAQPDFDAGTVEMSVLVRDGVTWRNDGTGWYETDKPPGLGLDPATASLLPTLLREATGARQAAPRDGVDAARTLAATTKVADVPGIIAVDLADATEIVEPASLAFDDSGRLVSLTIIARNTNLDDYDLIVETTITFRYPPDPSPLPQPTPTYVAPAPDPDGETES